VSRLLHEGVRRWGDEAMTFSWELAATVILAIIGGLWSVYTFSKQRDEDRRWRQVQFLLELNQKFFDSPEIRRCIRWLNDEDRQGDLGAIFQSRLAQLKPDELQVVEEFDRLFQFFDNLSHCHDMKVLTLDQINLFGWYLVKIGQNKCLRDFCNENGFEEVIRLADRIEKKFPD
jgi:hypothetical protein